MAGDTFLNLTNELLDHFNENNLDSSTFASTVGVHSVAKRAVRNAIRDINTANYFWPFNKQSGEQLLTIGTNLYSWPTGFKVVDMNSFYIEKDTDLNINTTPLNEITKEEWFRRYRPRDLDAEEDGVQMPTMVFHNGNTYGVTPSPDEDYTVKFDYYVMPNDLTDYDDTTSIPTDWNHVILEFGKVPMYEFRGNVEQAQFSKENAKTKLTNMKALLINDEFKVYVGQKNRRGYYAGQNSSSEGYL